MRVTSSNPAVAVVAPDATTPGTAFIDIPLTAPSTGFGFYVQGVEGQTGTVTFPATAAGFTDASAPVTVRGLGMDVLSVPAATTSLSPNDAFRCGSGCWTRRGRRLRRSR